jgi:NRE family putative nickel resistance protein-like MFS transporter
MRTAEDPARPTTLWANRNYVALFAAQVVSLAGSGMTSIGLALFAYQFAGGVSATAVIGNALMLRILAFLVFSQPAGVLADRLDRKKILVAADLARFALLALFPFITSVWQVYALIFAINAVTAFFTPTYEASLPEVVGKEHYVRALSLSRVAVDVEAIASPALAGLVVAIAGVTWLFWFDALTYLVSAALVLAATMPRVARASGPLSLPAFLGELTHGTRVLLGEPALRKALLLSVAEATAGAAAIVVTVAYVEGVLGQSETVFTLVMAALGLGSTVMALLLGRTTRGYERGAAGAALHGARHRWSGRALIAGGAALGLSLLPGYFVPPVAVFAALWTLNGAGQALVAISSSTLLAEHTTEAERGRAYAAHFALTHAFWLVSYPAVGHAAARWGAPATFTVAGLACLVVTAFATLVAPGDLSPHSHESDGAEVP